jgi:hypothetical protein
MLSELSSWFPDIDYEFIEEFDQEDLTDEIINENFDLQDFEKKFDRQMLRSEMSLCMKYKEAVNKISNMDKGEEFFILEDDVIFKENPLTYVDAMHDICEYNNINYDCVFLGEAWIRRGDDRDVFGKKEHPATNGLCTVLYKKHSLQRLNGLLQEKKITQPMDWELNDRFEDLDFQVYWGKALTRHGSVLATDDENFKGFKSSLRTKY